MAFNHISFGNEQRFDRMLRNLLNLMEQGDDLFTKVRDAMLQMRDGDGSQDIHYAEVARRFKVADFTTGDPSAAQNAKAREMFEELDSAYSKTSGNSSVDNVRAARDQLFAKLRG